jgi:hypothetical protein
VKGLSCKEGVKAAHAKAPGQEKRTMVVKVRKTMTEGLVDTVTRGGWGPLQPGIPRKKPSFKQS